MGRAWTAVGLVVAAFVGGSTAAVLPYVRGDDSGPCSSDIGSAGEAWQWWPFGYGCPVGAEYQGAPSVVGALVAVVVTLGVFAWAWPHRHRGWGRGVFDGVCALGVGGAMGSYAGLPGGWTLAVFCGTILVFAVDAVLTPAGDRSLGRSALAAVLIVPVTVSFAMFFALADLFVVTVATMLIALGLAAAGGAAAEWILRTPQPRAQPG